MRSHHEFDSKCKKQPIILEVKKKHIKAETKVTYFDSIIFLEVSLQNEEGTWDVYKRHAKNGIQQTLTYF